MTVPHEFAEVLAAMIESDRLPCGTDRKPHVPFVLARWQKVLFEHHGVAIPDTCMRCGAPCPAEVF